MVMKLCVCAMILLVGMSSYAAKMVQVSSGTSAVAVNIPAEYEGKSVSIIFGARSPVEFDDNIMTVSLRNPSGTTIWSRFTRILDGGAAWTLDLDGYFEATFTAVEGAYSLRAATGKGTGCSIYDIIYIVWDAPGEDVTNLQTQINADLAALTALVQTGDANLRAELMAYITALQEKADSLDEKDAALQAQLDDQIAVLTSFVSQKLSVRKTELETEIATLTAAMNAEGVSDAQKAIYQKQISDLNTQLTAINNAIAAGITDMQTALEGKHLDQVAGDAILKAALEAMNKSLREELNQYKTEKALELSNLEKAMAKRMTSLENRLYYSLLTDERLAFLKTDKETKVNAKANEVAKLRLEVENMRANGEDVTEKEAELSVLVLEYEKLQLDYEDLMYAINLRKESEIAVHEQEIENLKALLAAMKVNLKDIETRLNDELELLKTKVEGSESQIADLVSQIGTLQKTVSNLASSGTASGMSSKSNYSLPSASSKEVPTDGRDLRTSPTTKLSW